MTVIAVDQLRYAFDHFRDDFCFLDTATRQTPHVTLKGNRLVRLMLLMDVRHPLRDSDGQLLEWCSSVGLPVHVLLNKADKLSRSKAQRTLSDLRQVLQDGNDTPISLVSARTGLGLEAVRDTLRAYLGESGTSSA